MLIRTFQYTCVLLSCLLAMAGCKDEDYAIPTPKDALQNDVIKRSLGPNLVGLNIEFAYAMALPPARGKITSAQVEATIPGAATTYLENKSYYTNGSGVDVGVEIGGASANNGGVTKVDFTRDTSAATLRYFYVVPEEARGKTVSFKFSATSSNGEKVTFDMGPFNVARMDMKLDLVVKDAANCFISIADMAVYNAADAAAKPAAIDLVYIYRALATATYNHSIVSPGTQAQYLQGAVMPAGVNKTSKVIKAWNLRDFHLARNRYNVYIDDIDFQQRDFAGAPDIAINLKAEAGAWVETADGKYRAYIYINKVDDAGKSATISIKRYPMQ